MVVRGSSRTGGGRHYSVASSPLVAAHAATSRVSCARMFQKLSRTARARGRVKSIDDPSLALAPSPWRARPRSTDDPVTEIFSRAFSSVRVRTTPVVFWRASASSFLPSHPAGRTAAAVGRAVGGDRTSTSRHRLTVRDPRGVSHRGCARDDTRASPRRAAAVVRAARRRGRGRRARSSDPRRVTAFARRTRGGDSEVKSGARRGADRDVAMATGLGLGQFAFVGTFIAAVKKTIAGPRGTSRTPEVRHHAGAVHRSRGVGADGVHRTSGDSQVVECEISPTDPTSNVELWCTDIVPNWSLRQSVDEWGLANGYGVLDPPEEATRVTKDGTHVAGCAPNADVRRRAHPPVSAGVASRASATSGNLSISHDFHAGNHHGDDAHRGRSIYSGVGELLATPRLAWFVAGPAQSAVWWGGVGAFFGSRIGQAIRRSARSGASARNSRRGLFLRLGARR